MLFAGRVRSGSSDYETLREDSTDDLSSLATPSTAQNTTISFPSSPLFPSSSPFPSTTTTTSPSNYSTCSPSTATSSTNYSSRKESREWRADLFFVLYLPLYWSYLFLGAALFSQIEGPMEREYIVRLQRARANFLMTHPCVPDAALEDLIVDILQANNRGVSAVRNVTSEPNWSFGQAFFFSSTIVTTIGYGHVHPLSEGGKIFCIIYAVIGIPMTFILLTALVERLLIPTTWLLYWLNSKLGHLYQPFNIRVFHLGIIGVVSMVFFMVFPALIFAKLEPGWDFLDSFYYCFISLTTIGLGDYIPGDARDQPLRPLYKVCITGYLLMGLTFVMLLLHLYNDIPQLNLGLFLLRSSDVAGADPERMRLSGTTAHTPKYTQHNDQPVRQNVKVVSRPVDSPSPEEDTTPVHAQLPPILHPPTH